MQCLCPTSELTADWELLLHLRAAGDRSSVDIAGTCLQELPGGAVFAAVGATLLYE